MSLEHVLNATSVAVVGASRNETKRGYQAIKTLLEEGYDGPIYPVNPKEQRILGMFCYPTVSSIEEPVDLALITTPAKTIPAILEDCGNKGVCGAVIIAGGFGEIGPEGRRLEEQIVEIAREHGVRIIGPNTSGMINLRSRLDIVGIGHLPAGDIALLSQSGNMALTVMTEGAIKSRMGFSYYVGVGNEADIRFHEYLEFLEQDDGTRAILMYVEGMREGRKFLQQAHKTTRKKPIIVLKAGRTDTGRRSAGSHTGALAGISEVARSAFVRAGISVVESSDELFPVAESLASLPPVRNRSVAILADGGGHATIAADELTELGVQLPTLSEKTQAKLREILPAAAAVANPIDVAGGADSSPDVLADCAKLLLHDHDVGGLLVVGLFGGYAIRFAESLAFVEEDAAHRMGKLVRESRKPIIVHSLYNHAKPHSLDLLRYYGIPVYDSVEIACRCMGALSDYGAFRKSYEAKQNFVFDWRAKAKPAGAAILDKVRDEGRRALLEPEARELIALHGAPVPASAVATSADEAAAAVAELAVPVALKIVSPDVLHKSDSGGVELGIEGAEACRAAYERIMNNVARHEPEARIDGVLVSPMVGKGLEVIVGTKLDEQFGPIIMFGIGGIMVEVLKDVSFRVLPISRRSAGLMIDEIKARALIDGFRGQPPVDRKAIQRLLLAVSELMESYPEILEMDLNPVIVHEEGLDVVDARIILAEG